MGEWVTLADGSKLFCPYPLEQRPLPGRGVRRAELAELARRARARQRPGVHRGAQVLYGQDRYGNRMAADGRPARARRARGRGRHRGLALEGRGRTPLRRRSAKGSLAAAGMAVGWAFVAWMTTAAAVALTALTVALMAA